MIQVQPFLMFQNGQAQPAIDFYLSVFPDAAVVSMLRYGAGEPGKEGTIKTASFSIGGQTVMCTDSPIPHGFDFTPSFSLFVTCESEAQLDEFAAKLSDGGKFLMPPGAYGFSRKFTWVADRFGVSWQVNLP